jgi:hexosaminidase
MAAAKMNVLHLHLTDDQGFSVESKRYPNMPTPSDIYVHFEHKLKDKTVETTKYFYTQEELKQLVNYAIRVGVRIIPEFGVPGLCHSLPLLLKPFVGHTGAWFNAGIITNCPKFACSRAWSMVMNPTLEKTYEVIQRILEEMSEVFPDPVMHLGGDEVWPDCWREDQSIWTYMRTNGIPNYDKLLHKFEDRLWSIITSLPQSKKVIRWEETYPLL